MNTIMNLSPNMVPVGPHLFQHEKFLGSKNVMLDSLDLVKCKTRFNGDTFREIVQAVTSHLESTYSITGLHHCTSHFDGGRSGSLYVSSVNNVTDMIISVTNNGLCVSAPVSRVKPASDIYSLISNTFYVSRDCQGNGYDGEADSKAVGIEYLYYSRGELHQETYSRYPSKDMIDELYQDIDPRRMIEQFYSSRDTILFMHGEPGVGKSQIVQYGIDYLSKTGTVFNKDAYGWKENTTPCLWYVKDLAVLQMDEFWSRLVAREPEMVVFDDISTGIAPRGRREDMNFVEKFLSISDGIFRIRTKFIFTTNQDKEDIDSALLRPGRCFDYFHMKPLTGDYARSLINRLLERNGVEHTNVFDDATSVSQALFCQTLDRLIRKPGTYYRNSL